MGDGCPPLVDFDCLEIFYLEVKPVTIQTVLSIAYSRDWVIHQLDVKNAYLHGDIQEAVYMHQPVGFHNSNQYAYVSLLQQSLYGLKYAVRLDIKYLLILSLELVLLTTLQIINYSSTKIVLTLLIFFFMWMIFY